MEDVTTTTLEGTTDNTSDVEVMDDFGRTEAERTVVLEPAQAEAVNLEVEVGKHDSYQDALAHIITRGLAEIKRQRDNAAKIAAQKDKAKAMDAFSELLRLNPAIVGNAEQLQAAMAKLGITAPKK